MKKPTNQPTRSKAKILLIDIETSFMLAGVWGRRDQNISMDQVFQDTYVLTWAAKWLDKKKMMSDALYLHPKTYKKDRTNDRAILETIWKLLDEADYVIGHNGQKFDVPVLNARFIQHGMTPPSPYIVIDTLLMARRRFRFSSNKLDDLGRALKVGRKTDTGGFKLWTDIVMHGDMKAFKHMLAYNKQDVRLLESVYNILKAWDTQHPNTNLLEGDDKLQCNACGSAKLQRRGLARTGANVYQRFQCQDCGAWSRTTKAEKTTKPKLKSI